MSSSGKALLDPSYPAGAGAFLVKNGDVQLAVCDEAMRIVAVNPAWRSGIGRAGGAEVGCRLEDAVPAQVLDQQIAWRTKAAGAQSLFPVETIEAGQRWMEGGFKAQGRQQLIAIVDVTDARTEVARVQAARRARDLLLADNGVETWRYNPDDDVFYLSPELTNDYRLDHPPTVSGDVFDSLRHPQDRVLEREARERVSREGGFGEVETRVRGLGDLGWRHVRVHMRSGHPLPSGGFEVLGHTSVISEIDKARDDARSSVQFLEIALSAAQAGVFEVDHLAQTFRCSPEFIQIVGRALTYEEGRDAAWPELPPEDVEAMQRMQGRWGSPGHLYVDVRGGRDGRWIRFYCKVARDEAGIGMGAVGLVLDIEDAKRQELDLIAAQKAAQAATESKSSFLASVSHEIRTPMNGIVGVLHLLKSEPISTDGRRLLDEALACSGMLGQLINDVLDISKIEADMLELAPEPTRLTDPLEGVAGLLAPQAEAKGLYLRTKVDPELGWGMVDGVRLRQCLFNLVGNAVKFTEAGGVEVRMFRPEPNRLRIEIQDTGIGIGPEAKALLFQRFVQVDDTTTRSFSGTGLGLAISRNLARMMDGDVGFDSVEGVGSTFWIEVAAPPVAAPAPGGDGENDLTLGGLMILLVDDNPTNRLVGGKILRALGAEVSVCDSGAEAVERADREAFDLILMDVNMPGMDGVEATRRIRALSGPRGEVPIVALTANVMAHQRRAYLDAGMNGVVPKPLSPAALMTEILRLASGEPPEAPEQAA